MSLSTQSRKNRSAYQKAVLGAVAAVKGGMSQHDAAVKFHKYFRSRKGTEWADDPEQIFSNGLAKVMSWPEEEDGFRLPGLPKTQALAAATFTNIKPPIISGNNRVSAEDQLEQNEKEIEALLAQLS